MKQVEQRVDAEKQWAEEKRQVRSVQVQDVKYCILIKIL